MSNGKVILYVAESYSPHDRRLLRAIRDKMVKVWFASFDSSLSLDERLLPKGVYAWPEKSEKLDKWQELINENGIDTVFAGPLNNVVLEVAKNIDCPLVGISWGSDVLLHGLNSDLQRRRIVEALSYVNAVIVDCEVVMQILRKWQPTPTFGFVKFPYGIELSRFNSFPEPHSDYIREKLGWIDKTVMISTRSWRHSSGILNLLDAVAMVSKKVGNLRLLLIGDGPLKGEILDRVESLGMSDNVHCPGRIDENELPVWYRAADIYVSSSLIDGTSISLLEAMACELPVIVHNEYGNIEWVNENENGWLLDFRMPKDICEGILLALQRKELFTIMGKVNREKVFGCASWQKNSKKLEKAQTIASEYFQNNGKKRLSKN